MARGIRGVVGLSETVSSSRQETEQVSSPGSRVSHGYLIPSAIVVAVALIVGALFALRIVRLGPSAGDLAGGVIDPPMPAPDFTLHDQFDQPVRLSSFRGKVVVLTFLYTNCPDACPLITEKLHQAYGLLGSDTSRVQFLAVTVDPERDTVQQVRTYSAEKDMLNKWHFLVGPMDQVKPVWDAYGAGAAREDLIDDQAKATAVAAGLVTPTPVPENGYVVDHSAPIFVIDPTGQARAILDINFAPQDLVQDVRALLRS